MKSYPLYIVDTNVPMTANKALSHLDNDCSDCCITACIEAIKPIISTRTSLVIDNGGEILAEYRKNLSLRGQPNIGDLFAKWAHDNQGYFHQVTITKQGDSYQEFPVHNRLSNFDINDRKFVAAAHAHPKKPPILQATDSKWWGWKEALAEVGITVHFLCPDFVAEKAPKKSKKQAIHRRDESVRERKKTLKSSAPRKS